MPGSDGSHDELGPLPGALVSIAFHQPHDTIAPTKNHDRHFAASRISLFAWSHGMNSSLPSLSA